MPIETRTEAGGVRVLTLDHPPANAIDRDLLDALGDACAAAARDDAVSAIILTGKGRFFCGGLDLKYMTSTPGGMSLGFDLGNGDGVYALWTLPKPTVAMINGHAIAGGAILALACDVRIAAATGAKIGLNEVAIGLAYPIGAFELARLALTTQQAKRVMLGAQLHDAAAACALGLVDESVDPGQLEEVCLNRARLLGSYSGQAYAHTKHNLQKEAIERVAHQTTAYRQRIEKIWTSPEAKRIIEAQLAALAKK